MQFKTIAKRTSFVNNKLISSFHYNMFHGVADDGIEIPRNSACWDSTIATPALQVFRTIHRVPAICKPAANLVVNENVASILRGLPNIRLMPVRFARLVDISWQTGSNSWTKLYGKHDPEMYLRTFPDVSPNHDLGTYYELLTRRLRDVENAFTNTHRIIIDQGPPEIPRRLSVNVSADLFSQHPIIWSRDVFLTTEVFDRLVPYLDLDFFFVRTYSID